MNKLEVVKLINEIITNDEIKIDEPMKNHITFKVGGNADIFVVPKSKQHIIDIIKVCNQNEIPLITIGNGSNIIVRDKGIRGVVMKIFNNYSKIIVENEIIRSESGAVLSKLANIALANSLSGLEFAGGIPGTIGGAVTMNAGAYGGQMKDVVLKTEAVDKTGTIRILEGDEHNFGYRESSIQKDEYVVLECTIGLYHKDYNEIKDTMDEFSRRRKEKQPLNYPSAGSVFKRPEGFFAGKLIEDCGLKGYSIGGAQISELHSGFIINNKNATSKDIMDLIKYIQTKVKEQFGIQLETEAKIIGEE